MNNFNQIEKLTFRLYDNIKRFQINIDESLAITLALIYAIYTNYNSNIYRIIDYINNNFNASFITQKTFQYIIDNIRKYDIHYTVPKNIIKNAIEKLIDEKSPLLQTSNRKTATFTQKIITKIANKLTEKGNYIDLATGTGSLLKDLDGEVYGIDINPKMVIIARVYLFFCEKYEKLSNHHWEANITQRDAIDDYIPYKNNGNNVIIFDPPMGDFRQYPESGGWYNTAILGFRKPTKLQSELLFLLSFLINANDNDYFIGLFPENILVKNNKDYAFIRKYLIKNSLIAVVKVLEAHVLLIGKKKLDIKKYKEIPVIRIQTDLNEKQLDFISSEIIKGENFDFEKYLKTEPDKNSESIVRVIYNRQDFKNNYIINLPSKINYKDTFKDQIKSAKELLNALQEKENKIKILMQNLSENIADTGLDSDNIEEKQLKPLWFEEYDEKQETKLINALNYFYQMSYQLTPDNINDYQDFQIRENMNENSYYNLKILYQNGRVKLSDTKAEIFFGNNEKLKFTNTDLNEFYKAFNPMKEKKIKTIIQMLATDNNVKIIFEDLCRYWMLDQNEDNTLLKQKELSIKEFTRCLKVLENLGLVVFNKREVPISEEGGAEIDLYKRFIPNIKYIHTVKFEELQNV